MAARLKIAASILLLVLVVLAAPLLFPPKGEPTSGQAITHGLPWQIETPAPGVSRVFGLTLGGANPSTLADARRAFAEEFRLALLAPQDAPLVLEAYFESVAIGPLTGKLVLGLAAPAQEIEAMRERAAKTNHLDTGLRQFSLGDADRERAEGLPIASVSFIPSASLDEGIILQRFGAPAERIRQGETLEHFLYPARGLDVVLDAKGKEVLQYVAPADFARLRTPLGR